MNIESINEVVVFNDEDLSLEVSVSSNADTIWLNRAQISELFDKDIKTIGRHINNILREDELKANSVVAKFATTASDGKKYQTEFYNLDMIISVGYRVKSKRATRFRKWATKVLTEYAIKGYAVNQNKASYIELMQVIKLLERTTTHMESKDILNILEQYTMGLQLLDDYDHQRISKPKGIASTHLLTYDECIMLINEMKKQNKSAVFGIERGGEFKSSISAIYQTFDGKEMYPTLEEKAAHLLYFLVKNHGFSDGNKRIAAAIFIYFLSKNQALIRNKEQVIDNKTLVALTILLAESRPDEKDLMINLIMNILAQENY